MTGGTNVLLAVDGERAAELREVVEATGHCVTVANGVREAEARRRNRRFECVVDASDLSGSGDLELLERRHARDDATETFVVVRRDASASVVRRALNRGADRFLDLAASDVDVEAVTDVVREVTGGDDFPDWYRLAIADARLPMAAVDREYVIQFANDAYRDHHGLGEGSVVGERVVSVLGESAFEQLRPHLDRALDGETARMGPNDVATDDGGQFEVRWYPLSAGGDVVGAGVAMRDVTERQWAEHRFETFFETMPVAGFVLDDEGVTTEVNPTFCERTGYDREDVVGKPLDELPGILPDADREKTIERFEQLSEGEQLPAAEIEYHTEDGEQRYAIVESVPLMRDGGFEKLVGISRDITELKRRERELARQNDRLERFANIVSHDLRNPLEVAAAEIDLARRSDDDVDLERIDASLDRMRRIVDDVLRMAREGGTVEETAPVSLSNLAEAAWNHVETGDATLQVESDAVIAADRSRLQELVENLYRNSVEHGSPGDPAGADDPPEREAEPVEIRVGATDGGFFVADDGPGIDPEERESVFEVGYTTAEDGTGFGLNVVEEIADAHGWTVGVTDSEADGARFEFQGVERC